MSATEHPTILHAPETLPAGARVILGLSGGVDSAVAAWKLKQAGCHVSALFMKNWEDDDDAEYCSTRQDLIDCVSICDLLGIELDVVNFSAEYKDRVFADFLREYQAGHTPNPDILCNSEIKFRAFLDHALHLGADYIATGHYARVRRLRDTDGTERSELLKAVDASKDQSYFLYRLNQSQLGRALFPLGGMHKRDVRRLAEEIGLPVAAKKDSTGICFIGERPFREFLARYLPAHPGEIRALEDNRLLGEHQGLMYHTIGQRKGLHIGGLRQHAGAAGEHQAWYVAAKSVQDNILYVVQGHDHPALLHSTLPLAEPSWIAGTPPRPDEPYTAKPRYRTPDTPCTYRPPENGQPPALCFAQPVWAAAPGQSAVLYQGDVCLGGGIIA